MKHCRIVNEELLETVRNLPCLACASIDPEGAREAMWENKIRSHPHHVKTKKSGGPDLPHNLAPLCFKHHRSIHDIGTEAMADQFMVFRDWLVLGGWEYSQEQGWTNPLNSLPKD